MKERFKNTLAVLEYLKAEGYKIGRDKIYSDAKKGLLRVQDDKSVLGADVTLYASACLPKLVDSGGDASEAQALKARKEAELLDLKIEKTQFELDKERGKYLKKKDFAMEMAARAVVLDSGIRHHFRVNVSEYIAIAGGDPLKANQVLDRLNEDLDAAMTEFATTSTFQVMIVSGEEEDE